MTDSFNAVNGSAAELLGAAAAPVFTAPQPVPVEVSAPVASADHEEPSAPAEAEPEETEAPVYEPETAEFPEPAAEEHETPAEEEPQTEPALSDAAEEDAPALFGDWSGDRKSVV